jgi:predicted DNA-binding WGR domain protein
MAQISDTYDSRIQLLLERRDPDQNAARFYVLAIEPTLFGDAALVREWGRIGTIGRRRLDLFATQSAASDALGTWFARKMQRGYRLVATNTLG